MIPAKKKNLNDDCSSLAKNIIRTLAYFDIFNYPLTREEIYNSTNTNGEDKSTVFCELELLVSRGIVNSKENFYSVNNSVHFIKRRIEGNIRAEKKLTTAGRFSKFISYFPYIRGVLLSGSISKGYMDEQADIDYFLVTEPGRLWIARMCLVLFKKIFLFNSYKLFCINYFITTDNLEIEEKNIYTAIELATLIPTCNYSVYDNLYNNNKWIKSFVPNYPKKNATKVFCNKKRLTQKIIEPFFNNSLGEKLDDFFMKLFIRVDKKRYSTLDEDAFKIAFKSGKNVSKHHPNYFQKRVLSELSNNLKQIEEMHGISLN